MSYIGLWYSHVGRMLLVKKVIANLVKYTYCPLA